ncbi:MAG: cardiolipin synthase [Fretibacterium sp.]|nr:cardiolipin synthase [Fretibacterium sp.]
MRLRLRTLLLYTFSLLGLFVLLLYLLSLKTSPIVWVQGGLALSQEVWSHIYAFWNVVRRYIHWILGAYAVTAAIVVLLEEQNPDRANLWLFTLLLFPFVGIAAYMFFGPNVKSVPHRWRERRLTRKHLRRRWGKHPSQIGPGLSYLLAVSCGALPTRKNQVELLLNGTQTFEAIEKALSEAREYINMEYFSVASDELGTHIGAILADRARAGVKVRFLYDAVGSWNIGREYLERLREAGVEVEAFMPVAFARFRSGLNHRDHRKIVVVDGRIGFLGGLNIGDMYLGKNPRMGPWRDTHLSIRGEAVQELNRVFLELWERCVGTKAPPCTFPDPPPHEEGDALVQIASSGPGRSFRAIADGYFHMISGAKKRVWITTPYLVPGEALSNALSVAARSGVDVRIIVPFKADHTLVFWASQFNVDSLLRSGVRVFSYKKGFIHAKTMTADSSIVSVGTTNLDVRSLEVNYEVQAFIHSPSLAARMEAEFLNDLKCCEEETLTGRKRRSPLKKLQAAIGRLWSALL